jgi:ABC-type dipeptide/oligopeptide/nickel transport system ATPase component
VDRSSVDEREVLAIVGESGSGKSVSMLAVMGLLPDTPRSRPTDDLRRPRPADHDPASERARSSASDIAMIFQEPIASLNPCFTVGFQIEEVLRSTSASTARRAAPGRSNCSAGRHPRSRRRAERLPAPDVGRQCQRVMIAMAIACNPKLLIADEPTTALDVTIQKQILDLLMKLQAEHGMALIMITHNMGVVAETADRVIVQYKGRKMEEADVLILFENPKNPYTRRCCRPCRKMPPATGCRPWPTSWPRRRRNDAGVEGKNLCRDYHVRRRPVRAAEDRHAVKGVSFKVERARRWPSSASPAAASRRWRASSR